MRVKMKVLTREPMLYFKDKVMERLRDDTVPIQKRIDDTEKVLTRLAEILPNRETYATAVAGEVVNRVRMDRKCRLQVIVIWLLSAVAIIGFLAILAAPFLVKEEPEQIPYEPTSDILAEWTDHPIRHTYPRYDVPLDRYQQETLYNACQEWGVPYELALAVCWRETNYRDLVTTNDTGTYYGMMAVKQSESGYFMDLCGVEYLNSEEDRLRVGCCILGYYLDQYDSTHRALMAYNGGPGYADAKWALGVYYTTYTIDIMNYMENLME